MVDKKAKNPELKVKVEMMVDKKAKNPELKVKVVTISDYLVRAKELFGSERRWENAVALLYSENEVIQVVERKGEQKFVVKI